VSRALLLVDVLKDFRHEDGDRLLESYRTRHESLTGLLHDARSSGSPVVYANDNGGVWDSDAPSLVKRAVDEGKAGKLVAAVAPHAGEVVVLKPRYSAFDATPLESVLRRELDADRLTVAGTATEMCVFQTVTDALRLGFEVTVRADACATVDEDNERVALDYLERVLGVDVSGR
jgi:nicotinamidase-related amidase